MGPRNRRGGEISSIPLAATLSIIAMLSEHIIDCRDSKSIISKADIIISGTAQTPVTSNVIGIPVTSNVIGSTFVSRFYNDPTTASKLQKP